MLDEPHRNLVDGGHESGLLDVHKERVEIDIYTVGGSLSQEFKLLHVVRKLLGGFFNPERFFFRFDFSSKVCDHLFNDIFVDTTSDSKSFNHEVLKVINMGELFRGCLLFVNVCLRVGISVLEDQLSFEAAHEFSNCVK